MQVKFFATYRELTHCNKLELPAPAHVHALLWELSARFGREMRDKLLSADGEALGQDAIVLVNGRHIVHLQGLATPLDEQDTVAVFPLVAGG